MKKDTPVSFVWLYAVVAAGAVIASCVGWHLVQSAQASNNLIYNNLGWTLIGGAALAIVAMLVAIPILRSLEIGSKLQIKHHREMLTSLSEQIQQVCLLLNLSSENQLISDRTKAVAFREKDRETIRRAVQEEMSKQDWETALALVNEMDTVFGYKTEADRFRQEINSKRQDVTHRQVTEQMAIIDRYTHAEAWNQALTEAGRIMALFPNDEQVSRLPLEIESRRQACKKKLLDAWHEAVARHDVDESIEVLKHLDTYLTAAEAEGMQETARGVFKEKIALLRTQFAMAVQDKRWAEAIRLGDTIMAEFPNSRMAQEVREKMDMLRQRAASDAVATA